MAVSSLSPSRMKMSHRRRVRVNGVCREGWRGGVHRHKQVTAEFVYAGGFERFPAKARVGGFSGSFPDLRAPPTRLGER